MDGIINLFKPVGITSAKAVYRVRKLTGVRKSGHAGTLDPGAEGVLLVCQGRATKLVEQIMDLPKVYRTRARLDVTSTSFDSDSPLTPVPVARIPEPGQVAEALAGFEGDILQTPPAVSAIKIGGVPAYKLARSGKTPVISPRPVRIYWMQVGRIEWPHVEFEMACSRGTYVRAVIRDLGERLGCGGCLTALCRTAIGPFKAEQSVTFEELETSGQGTGILPLSDATRWVRDGAGSIPARPTKLADKRFQEGSS